MKDQKVKPDQSKTNVNVNVRFQKSISIDEHVPVGPLLIPSCKVKDFHREYLKM